MHYVKLRSQWNGLLDRLSDEMLHEWDVPSEGNGLPSPLTRA